ncbi:hypothetical protein [Methanobrevibacter sp.]|uniref:hypothetical protein n=1 Tax=Methanobrevibacter sp. TaxID=66852 RepID=UPI00386ACC7A
MLIFYKLSILPSLLKHFKVKNVIISGLKDENLVNEVLNYDAEFTAIDINKTHAVIDTINGNPLEILPSQENYEAIFINDDPNWYTLYNELNIIKNTNKEFPLVFICNNRFPHKRRDSYSDPDIIPQEYLQKNVKELPICYNNKKIVIADDYYHACNEDTPKNGVLTAIEDFIAENPHIGILDMNFIEEITILCPKNTISTIRIDNVKRENEDKKLNYEGLSDKLNENKLLVDYIEKYNLSVDEAIIGDINTMNNYKNKIQLQDSQLQFKDSQIIDVNSKLSLKDLEIKNIESKLVNKENEINDLEIQLDSANKEISLLKNEIEQETSMAKDKEADLNQQIKTANKEIETLTENEVDLRNQLETANNQLSRFKNLDSEMESTKKLLNTIKRSHTHQINKLDTKEYCITCFKEEITNNHLEIDYLKNKSLIRKILSPFSYIYLIFKSKPKELPINIKLYKALNNSKCFDIGYYLNNNTDVQKGKWIKYFSPELHYVCKGFDENRKFNKKYFNRHSKEELLDYLLTCESKQ